MMKIIVMMKKWIRTCHTYKCKGKDDDGRGEALGGDGIIFFFSHSSFLVEKGGLLAVGGVEWEGFPTNHDPSLPSSTTQPYTPHSSFTHQMVQTQTILIRTRPCSTNSIVCKCLLPSSAGLRATCLSDSRESLKMVSVPPGSRFFLGCHRVQFLDLCCF